MRRTSRQWWAVMAAVVAACLPLKAVEAQNCDCNACSDCAAGASIMDTQPGSIEDSAVSPQIPDLAFSERGSAFSGSTFAAPVAPGGYVEPAIIRSQARFRFEAAYDFNRPDRAEFYYTTWRSLGGKNPNPNDNPPGFPEPEIDRQQISLYLEHAVSRNLSFYVDLPYVFSDPLRNPNDQAFGDMQAGFKTAIFRDCDQLLTFRLNNYIPTADAAEDWVGTGHYSIEPGFLYQATLKDGWTLQAELRDWISINGAESAAGDYAGNVLRYGVGLAFDWIKGCNHRVTPVVEMVGWSVLEGQVFDFNDAAVDRTNGSLTAGNIGPVDADGDTIINIKIGARIADYCGSSIYAGWGHALSDDRWYEDIFRLEFRRFF